MPRKQGQSSLAAYLGYAQARALLLGSFATKAVSISACSHGADRAARLAALAAERHAALEALSREWRARRVRTVSIAKIEVTFRRCKPSHREAALRPVARRPTYQVKFQP
jgi:hypothetical protein